MIAEVGGVVVGPVDEARPAASEKRHPEQVQTGCVADHTAVVTYVTGAVDDREVQPGEVGPVAAGPDDRPDIAPAEVDGQGRRRGRVGRIEAVRGVDDVVETGGAGPGVEGVEEAVHLQVGEGAEVGERAGELGHAVAEPAEPPDELHPPGGERVQVDRGAFGSADELGRRDVARPDDVVDLVVTRSSTPAASIHQKMSWPR